ncbi:MAG: NAD-dependent epimerase/dehydratase family protein [Deltaproteobacteria bacterium]|nr:NAD-dependent epimerase/dehydratase family protein [Deltaproteobacteria bacterium]MBW2389564.1 NAD-dependent epimerase/dehydratase family protein [Deltaproteobacteria bacterium]
MRSDSSQGVLVTGAAGFLGRNLVRSLLARGHRVRALIHRTPMEIEHPALECLSGDVADAAVAREACHEIDLVLHTAAKIALFGGSSVTESYRTAAWRTNVDGTELLLEAAQRRGATRFVYTSTVDVCFAGQPCTQMDRTTPYVVAPKSVYVASKIAAERAVLAANAEGRFHTCSIRPDGIYGPGANMMMDRFIPELAAGHLRVGVGSPSSIQDNSHVDNLVHAELLAAEQLGPGGRANGNAYFVSDDAPMNSFEFFRPIIEDLGGKVPGLFVPAHVIAPIVRAWEHLHFRLGLPEPMLSPHELDKVSVSHYGSNRDAERDLGYRPVIGYREAIAGCLPYCRELFAACRSKAPA